jgi:hypothetical protein
MSSGSADGAGEAAAEASAPVGASAPTVRSGPAGSSAPAGGLLRRLASPGGPFGPLVRSVVVGRWRLPPIGLLVLAAIGGVLLAVIATTSWQEGTDELAYWRAAERLLAGQALYDPTAVPNTPFAYWNPPPLAQLLAPLTPFLTPEWFTAIWTVLLLACLWWLGGRNPVVGLALIAFLPVAVELRTRNLHLVLAVLVVLALRRSWVFWVAATALKISPVLGGLYLVAAGRVREAIQVAVLGAVVLAISVVLAPGAWVDFISIVGGRAGSEGGGLVAVPFWLRFLLGAVLAAAGGRLGGRRGEVLLVVGLTVANPTLWATALSLLVAIVPLLRTSSRPLQLREGPGGPATPARPSAG